MTMPTKFLLKAKVKTDRFGAVYMQKTIILRWKEHNDFAQKLTTAEGSSRATHGLLVLMQGGKHNASMTSAKDI